MEPEKTIHQTSPSQIVNLKYFVFCGLLAVGVIVLSVVLGNPTVLVFLILPVVYAWWKWMLVKSTRLTVTDQRLMYRKAFFTR